MKGIILTAGLGTRLYPLTLHTSKQLLPVYDKPMVYYPLATLMEAGIKDILIITSPTEKEQFIRALGDGHQYGINLSYEVQYVQRGISDAFIIAEQWINKENVALILGDNIFTGITIKKILKESIDKLYKTGKSSIFGYKVEDPERFGVVEFDNEMKVLSIEEKPDKPKSKYAVTGLYFYDSHASEYAKQLKPSARGELEITDLNKMYLNQDTIDVSIFDDTINWIDTGTIDSLLDSSLLIKEIQKTGKMVGCIEEIAYNNGWITLGQLHKLGKKYEKTEYGKYILEL